ncbi:MAG: flavin-containing monooxygenase [Anaerolineales bacterium]
MNAERIPTVVVGGGQAGLSVGYYLSRRGLPFVILDAHGRVGDAWRKRWDSLRLFTPARLNGLPGMPFPGPRHSFPTKHEMADYLADYAARFDLPVRTGVRVDRLSRNGSRFVVSSGEGSIEADNVVVAMGSYQKPRVPPFAGELDPAIVQMHSTDYCNPSQLMDGGVLVVGAGNSGAEIALEVSRSHRTWLSGRDTGQLPFRIEGPFARFVFAPIVLPFLAKRVLTVDTPIGRKARLRLLSHSSPLVPVKREDLAAAGVERIPRTVGARGGLPLIEDGRVLEATNVIWSTGFTPDFSWVDLPVFDGEENPIEPRHRRGIVAAMPGLYFVGLAFLYSVASGVLAGVGRDAGYVVDHIVARGR